MKRRAKGPGEPLDFERLPRLSLAELRALWAERERGDPPAIRSILIRELAWRDQERRFGGFDPQTERMLRAAMRMAAKHTALKARGESSGSGDAQSRRKAPIPRRTSAIPNGSRLVRLWRGVTHEVTVLGERRYRYRDKEWGSLSEIARAITGAHWSGPRFFGLTRTPRKERDL